MQYIKWMVTGVLLVFGLVSCGFFDDNRYMSSSELKQLETAYTTMQTHYRSLISAYKAHSDTLSKEVQTLYQDMQKMHGQMDYNHQQMIARNRARNERGDKKMVSDRLRMHIQSHMTGEWYHQMKSVHQQLARMHRNKKQGSMAELNNKLAADYKAMLEFIPGLEETPKVPFNPQGNPSILNGKRLYIQNCASCHGREGKGVGNSFPPLVNSEWLTGDKSVPVRILLNGLTGPINVKGQKYSGYMPSFRARLSAAEMVSILNYLRVESKDSVSKISQDDVIRIGKTYRNRTSPWSAEALGKN